MRKKNYGIIVAAGKGKRMGADINKVYLQLGDKPIIVHTLESFCRTSKIDGIVVVLSAEDRGYFEREIIATYSFPKPILLAEGGKERQISVYNGLMALPADTDIVVIHDGARPFITPEMIERTIIEAQKNGAAVMAMPVKDTIKEVKSDFWVSSTLNRDILWLAQTPQTFSYPLIVQAHEKANEQGIIATDDSALVERLGMPVKIVLGSYENIKITTWEDMLLAERILSVRKKKEKEGENDENRAGI